jgi:hypothetical protein
MFKLRGQPHEAEKQKRKQLWGKEFNIVKNGLDEEQVIDFVNELVMQQESSSPASARLIIQTAIKGAEKIIDSIKVRAQAEAAEEAARIITQARQEAGGIKGEPEKVAEREVEDILSVANRVVEERTEEPAELFEKVAQPQEEAAEPEPMATAEESFDQHLPEERKSGREVKPSLSKAERQSLYTGEVELVVGVPVTPNMMAKLYDYLQTTPEIKFVRTSGSWNRGSIITVVLDKPISLISVISSKIPGAEVTPEQPGVDGFVKGRRGVRRISIAQKAS